MPTTMHEWISWLSGNFAGYFLPFLLVIAVLVFVHEWGHYIVARMCGVRVETFSIGFGKKLWSRKDKAGTEWQVALFPLGGYVKMYGDADPASGGHTDQVTEEGAEAPRPMTEAEKSEAFFAKPVWQRAAIVFAGPAINFIFAIILLTGIFASVGRPVTPPVAAAVVVGSAAETAGFQPHDRVVSIDGERVVRFADIQRSVAISLDKPLTMDVERDGEIVTLENVMPKLDHAEDRFGFKHSRGLLGIIGASNGVSLDGIIAVDGVKGDVQAQLVKRMGQDVTLTMTPVGDAEPQKLLVHLDPAVNQALLDGDVDSGLVLADTTEREILTYNVGQAFNESLKETWFVTTGTLQALGQMVIGTRSAQELGGIIRIGAVTGDAAQAGIVALLILGALLSINLGLINLLPIPMLDGGHLMFYAIESLKGSPVSEKTQDAALRFGFYTLIGLMLFANVNDLLQLIS